MVNWKKLANWLIPKLEFGIGQFLPYGKMRTLGNAYWRLTVNDSQQSVNYVQLIQVELWVDPSASNLTTGGNATSSSVNGANVASRAIDNTTTTYWQLSTGAFPGWWQVQLVAPANPSVIGISSQVGSGNWKLEASNDGSNWTEVITANPYNAIFNTNTTDKMYFPIKGTNLEIWRIFVSKMYSSSVQMQINEIQLLDLTETNWFTSANGWPYASSATSGNSPNKLIDGNLTNSWTNLVTGGNYQDPANSSGDGVFFGFIFAPGKAPTLSNIWKIWVKNNTGGGIDSYKVQRSIDSGANWTDLYDNANPNPGSSSVHNVVTFPTIDTSKLLYYSKAEGSNNSTTLVDTGPNNISMVQRNAESVISNTQKRYGASSAFISAAGTATRGWKTSGYDLPYGLTDGSTTPCWSIDLWYYPTGFSANSYLMQIVSANGGYNTYIMVTTTGKLQVGYGGSTFSSNTVAANLNAWNHICICMDVLGYLHVTMNGRSTCATGYGNQAYTNCRLAVGSAWGDGSGSAQGYIDNVRILVGQSPFAGNFDISQLIPPD